MKVSPSNLVNMVDAAAAANPSSLESAQPAKIRKERKPDRQLYSVRNRQSMRQEVLKRNAENTTTTIDWSEKLNCSAIEKNEENSPYLQPVKDMLAVLDDKEIHPFEDDRLSVSNVSTAMSDLQEAHSKSDLLKEALHTEIPQEIELPNTLFDLNLEIGSGVMSLRIYQGEEDYEGILENFCSSNNFDERTGLYFKINILQMIKDTGFGSENVENALNKLLDINYKLIMYETGKMEAEESIKCYLEEIAPASEDGPGLEF